MTDKMNQNAVTRRDFIKGAGLLAAGAAAGFPAIVPSSVFGKNAPSNRIAVGFIGCGRQALGVNIQPFLTSKDVTLLAVCDVDSWRMDQAKQMVEKAYAKGAPGGKYKGCATFKDFRDLLARKDIDAVMVSTPDHWHVPISLAAMAAGKDVSCEKPLTLSIAEGRVLADAARKYNRITRTDSEFRSIPQFHRMVELVRNGRIGNVKRIFTGVPKGDVSCGPQPDMPVPPELDFDLWLGPAPKASYTLNRVHTPHDLKSRPLWMRRREYCEGMVTNWGTHLNDIAQWGNNTDHSGPVEVVATGTYPPKENFWNVLLSFEAHYKYASGVELNYVMERPYVRFEGDEGWLEYEYAGKELKASSEKILKSVIGPNEQHFTDKTDKRDFIDAVKTRQGTMEDFEVGHRTCSMCQLAHISIQLGGKALHWDPATERFDDEAANKLKQRPSWREPWTLEKMAQAKI